LFLSAGNKGFLKKEIYGNSEQATEISVGHSERATRRQAQKKRDGKCAVNEVETGLTFLLIGLHVREKVCSI